MDQQNASGTKDAKPGTGKDFSDLLKALEAAGDMDGDEEGMDEEEEGEGEGDGDEADGKIAAAAEGGKPMMKSMTVKDADGNEQEMVDATDLVKSLMERTEASETVLAKALETFTATVNKQTLLIKSLQSKVTKLEGQGRGRKTTLSVVEKPDAGATLAKSNAAGDAKDGITVEEFFAKANTAFDTGKLSGQELNTISVCLRSRTEIDPGLIKKVMG